MQFRILKTGYQNAAFNMALDEVLIERIALKKSLPALRFYGWSPKAISIGYFQSLEEEVDVEKSKNLNVDIVRRLTGGGAVFHDDEVTYSIHVPMDLNILPIQILPSYKKICEAIIEGLKFFDIQAQFAPLNDIVVDGQKISGNAQTRKKGIIMQHGTILKSVNVDEMFKLLKVPNEKLKGKLIDDIKKRVSSIDNCVQKQISFEQIVEALKSGFEKKFPNINFVPSKLSVEEEKEVLNLMKEKYKKTTWLSQR